MSDLTPLREPGQIGSLRLKNRFVQSPMHTLFASETGEVTEKITSYLVERALGGVGMIIVENTAIDWKVGRAAGNPLRIDDDRNIAGLSDLCLAVHNAGALVAVQLHHAGRQNKISNTEGRVGPVAPSPITSSAIGDEPRELTVPEIQAIVEQFAESAKRAVTAGFDVIEVHGSHGYLLTEFLSPQSNLRTDEYGGEFEGRARFPLEVVRAVREAVGPDVPISYRISVEERTPGGMSAEEGIAFCKLIEPYVDVFNVTVATYEAMDNIFMMQGSAPGQLLPLAARVKAAVSKPVIGVGRLGWALEEAASSVADGEIDFVSLGRTQLTDAYTVEKTLAGDGDRVRRCIGCNECVGRFLFNNRRVHCVINPELGFESKMPTLVGLSRRPRTIAVVGGGPSGFEFARVAAMKGHDVTLFEAADRIGGQARIAAVPKYKHTEMESYVRYFERELAHLGVAIEAGVKLSPEHMKDLDVEHLVLATGANPIETAGLLAVDALEERILVSGSVAVLGSNEIGLNTAAWTAERGHPTTLVTSGRPVGYDINPILAEHTEQLLVDLGVQIVDDSITADTVLHSPDYVALDRPDDSDWSTHGVDVESIGARIAGGRLFEATQSGFWSATRL